MSRALPHAAALLMVAVALLQAHEAAAQQNSCADCHLSRPDIRGARHVAEWDAGPHGRANVGCEACHGGTPGTFEAFRAHQGMLHRNHPASPVGRISLPGTCGQCHGGPYAAFRKSRHYELVRAGDRDAPTCVTCHGEVAGVRLSPRALEAQCASCHGPGKVAPNNDLPVEGRLLLQDVRDARTQLKEAEALIRRVTDASRRAAFEDAAAEAAVPLVAATNDGHAFVFEGLRERIAQARQRIAVLYDRLVNPPAR
jgi:hypothetical protein